MEKIYDIAISFAGEDRSIANEIASELKAKGATVFYDDFEKADLWGKDLYEYLIDIYKDKSKYCLMLLSAAYTNKLWTTHERRAAQARAFKESKEYILPLKLDDTEIPGILETIGYVDFRSESSASIADLLVSKLWGNITSDQGVDVLKTQLEQLYMRAMLLCELALMPIDHPNINQQALFPNLYEDASKMLKKLRQDLRINSPLMSRLILLQVTKVISALDNILERARFLFAINDPSLKDFFFIGEIPEADFYTVYRFLDRLKVFDAYSVKNMRHYRPEEIIDGWQRAESMYDRYSSKPEDSGNAGKLIPLLFDKDALRKFSGVVEGGKVAVFLP